jgi:cytoskeletal protein RodZ
MIRFSERKMLGNQLLGERLKELREAAGMTRSDLAVRAGMPDRYLAALEAGKYALLPGDVYVRNFLKVLARELGVEERRVLARYDEERRAGGTAQARGRSVEPPKAMKEPFRVTPRMVRIAAFAVAALGVAFYLGWQIQRVFSAPELVVASPEQNARLMERSVLVEGRTEPEAEVRVNGREIPVEKDGTFREQVNLRLGVNTIRITATRGRSAEAVDQRLVYVEPPDSG